MAQCTKPIKRPTFKQTCNVMNKAEIYVEQDRSHCTRDFKTLPADIHVTRSISRQSNTCEHYL